MTDEMDAAITQDVIELLTFEYTDGKPRMVKHLWMDLKERYPGLSFKVDEFGGEYGDRKDLDLWEWHKRHLDIFEYKRGLLLRKVQAAAR